MSLIFLIGMPGSGKSYWAKKISELYSIPLTDLDEYIELKETKSISALFASLGEDNFRKLETDALDEIITTRMPASMIVALGGGTPVFHNNLEKIKASGTVIYLKAEIDTLLWRVKNDPRKRPLLELEEHVKQVLESILSERKDIYEKAHHTLVVETLTVANFEKIIF